MNFGTTCGAAVRNLPSKCSTSSQNSRPQSPCYPVRLGASNQRLSRCVGQDELLVIITVRSTEFARATTYGVMFVWYLGAPGSETRSGRSRASWPGSPRAGFRGCREPQCFLPAPSPGLVTGEEMRRRAEGRDHGLLRRNRDGVATMFECSASWPSGYRARR
jgi:hypothetical protein